MLHDDSRHAVERQRVDADDDVRLLADQVHHSVTPNGPAAQAGLTVGDRVRALEGRRFDRYEPFLDLRRYGRPGQVVRLQVERDGVVRETAVTLLALYPIPFLIVTLVVLLQRPDDPHAWLLALVLGGFIAGAGITEFEYRVPAWLRGPLLALSMLLGAPLAGLTYAFFGVFPAHSPLDRRVPWLKTVGLVVGYTVAAVLAIGALVGRGSYFLFWLDERFAGWKAPIGILIPIYSVGFFLLAIVSLVQNAFGPTDVRRKTRVSCWGRCSAA